MKKYLSLFIFIALLTLSSAPLVKAEDTSVGTPPPNNKIEKKEIRQNIKDEREKIKNQIEALREVTKQKMEGLKNTIKNEKDAAKAKIKELRITGRENFLKGVDDRINNIKNLKTKINEQITKFDARSLDTTTAKNFVAEADAKITIAEGKITQINALLAGSTNKISADDKAKIKTLSDEIQTSIKDARTALQNSIKALKDIAKTKVETPKTESEDASKINQ